MQIHIRSEAYFPVQDVRTGQIQTGLKQERDEETVIQYKQPETLAKRGRTELIEEEMATGKRRITTILLDKLRARICKLWRPADATRSLGLWQPKTENNVLSVPKATQALLSPMYS